MSVIRSTHPAPGDSPNGTPDMIHLRVPYADNAMQDYWTFTGQKAFICESIVKKYHAREVIEQSVEKLSSVAVMHKFSLAVLPTRSSIGWAIPARVTPTCRERAIHGSSMTASATIPNPG